MTILDPILLSVQEQLLTYLLLLGTLARLNSEVSGALNFTYVDAVYMLQVRKPTQQYLYTKNANDTQLCAYETDALGYSAFCPLFTEADFESLECTTSHHFFLNVSR